MDTLRRLHRSAGLVLLVGIGVLLPACLTRTTGPGEPTVHVTGTVLAGPTCPVVTSDSTGCDPVPVAGKVLILRGTDVIGDVTIAQDGSFDIDIPEGTYTAKAVPSSTNGFPVCGDVPLVVNASDNPPLAIDCDTGIR